MKVLRFWIWGCLLFIFASLSVFAQNHKVRPFVPKASAVNRPVVFKIKIKRINGQTVYGENRKISLAFNRLPDGASGDPIADPLKTGQRVNATILGCDRNSLLIDPRVTDPTGQCSLVVNGANVTVVRARIKCKICRYKDL